MTLRLDDELIHYGVPGMKWGKRMAKKASDSRTNRMAKKDAKRYADAKMFYGKTAGTKRKLLKAELEKKRKTRDGYGAKFDSHVKNVDMAKSAKKAKRTRTRKDVTYRTKVNVRKINKVAGPLAIAAGAKYYQQNSEQINRKVRSAINKVRR